VLSLIPGAYAQDNGTELDLSNFDTALGNKLNISTFAGGLLASVILSFMFLLPIAVYSKNIYTVIIIGWLCMGFCVAVGWLDIWFLLVASLMVGLMFASKMRDFITGIRT